MNVLCVKGTQESFGICPCHGGNDQGLRPWVYLKDDRFIGVQSAKCGAVCELSSL